MDAFEATRAHLRAVAIRILGSRTEADDALQEAWLRYQRTDTSAVENPTAWLTTGVSRICLTMLASRRARREEALEQGRLPDPVIEPVADTTLDPEDEALTADAVGAALLVVLEMLAPAERRRLHRTAGHPRPRCRRPHRRGPGAAAADPRRPRGGDQRPLLRRPTWRPSGDRRRPHRVRGHRAGAAGRCAGLHGRARPEHRDRRPGRSAAGRRAPRP